MLTFISFKNVLGYPSVDELLIRAVMLLANSSVHALDAKLLFIDDDDAEYELDPAELEDARKEGALAHPVTGALIGDYERKVFPFFVPSDRLIGARAHA